MRNVCLSQINSLKCKLHSGSARHTHFTCRAHPCVVRFPAPLVNTVSWGTWLTHVPRCAFVILVKDVRKPLVWCNKVVLIFLKDRVYNVNVANLCSWKPSKAINVDMVIIQDLFLEHSSVSLSPVYQIHKHCSSKVCLRPFRYLIRAMSGQKDNINIVMSGQFHTLTMFLLLLLALPLLHLAQATTCQGDNCPTGDFYLD